MSRTQRNQPLRPTTYEESLQLLSRLMDGPNSDEILTHIVLGIRQMQGALAFFSQYRKVIGRKRIEFFHEKVQEQSDYLHQMVYRLRMPGNTLWKVTTHIHAPQRKNLVKNEAKTCVLFGRRILLQVIEQQMERDGVGEGTIEISLEWVRAMGRRAIELVTEIARRSGVVLDPQVMSLPVSTKTESEERITHDREPEGANP